MFLCMVKLISTLKDVAQVNSLTRAVSRAELSQLDLVSTMDLESFCIQNLSSKKLILLRVSRERLSSCKVSEA